MSKGSFSKWVSSTVILIDSVLKPGAFFVFVLVFITFMTSIKLKYSVFIFLRTMIYDIIMLSSSRKYNMKTKSRIREIKVYK